MPSMTTSIPASVERPTRVRYGILFFLFIVTAVNYADRATLSIVGTSLSDELGIDTVGMGYIFSALAWAYVICQIPGGAGGSIGSALGGSIFGALRSGRY